MTIEDFLRLLLRNLLLLIVVTVLGGAAGYGYSFTRPAIYSASALGYVGVSAGIDADGQTIVQSGSSMDAQYQRAQSYLPLFSTRAVGERIVSTTDLQMGPDQVAGSLHASLDPNAPIITVTATAGSAKDAGTIANAAVEAVAAEARSLESGGDENAESPYPLVAYQTALVPGAPVSPDRKKYLAAGALAGLLVALGIAVLRDRNDTRLRTADDIPEEFGLPLLGSIPDSKEMTRSKDGILPDPRAFAVREAFRKLRTNLRYVDVDSPPRSIVVTSSAPAEGKSTVSAELARVMARSGQATVLVDADLRRPMIATQFGVDHTVGLAQVVAGAVTLEDALVPTDVPGLMVLPAGQVPPNPSELLGSRRMKDLLQELARSRFVLVDAPPVLAVTDAQLLAHHADGAVLVAVPGKTSAQALAKAAEAVRGIGGKVHGLVFNRASTSRLSRLAYGDAEYGYGYSAYGAYGKYSEETPAAAEEVPAPLVPADAVPAGTPGSAPEPPAAAPARAAGTARTPAAGTAPTPSGAADPSPHMPPAPRRGRRAGRAAEEP